MSKVAVLGSGQVGQVLADGFLKHGHEVMRGTRDPSKLSDWLAKAGSKASVGTFAEASRFGEAVVLAVKTWGLPALVLTAVGLVPVMFVILVILARP